MNKNRANLSLAFTILLLSFAVLSAQGPAGRRRDRAMQAPPAQDTRRVESEQIVAPTEVKPEMVPTDRITERPPEPESKTWQKPRYMDARLDWCMHWATDCGRVVAVKFCRRHRYETVAAFEAEMGVPGTRLMGNNEFCTAFWCQSFSYITCSHPFSRADFPSGPVDVNPGWKEEKLRLAACWTPANGCSGKRAADAWCKGHGYSEALDFTVDQQLSTAKARYIGSNETCDYGCRGFQQIICKR